METDVHTEGGLTFPFGAARRMPIQTMHSETGEGAAPTAPVGVRVPVAWSMLKAWIVSESWLPASSSVPAALIWKLRGVSPPVSVIS